MFVINTILACFQAIPPQIYWGVVFGIVTAAVSIGIYKLDKNNNPLKFWKFFIDPNTNWPIFTNMVLFLVLIFSIWLSMLLSYHEQWKLAVELMEAIITAFVVKFGVGAFYDYIQKKYPTAQQIEAKQDAKESDVDLEKSK